MRSISNQLFIAIIFIALLAFGGLTYSETQNRTSEEKISIAENTGLAAYRLSKNLEYPIWNNDQAEVLKLINTGPWYKYIYAKVVFDEHNKSYSGAIVRNNVIQPISKDSLALLKNQTVVRPIIHGNKIIGKAVIYLTEKPLEALISKLRMALILRLTIILIILGVVLYFILKRLVIKPISMLTDWASTVNTEEMTAPPQLFQSTEIDSLATSFTQMTNRLMSSINEISEKNNRLIESEAHIKSISNNFTTGMIYQLVIKPDDTRTFTYLSDAVRTLYGISPEEGMADSSLIYGRLHPDDIAPLIAAEEEAIKTLSVFKKEARMISPSGVTRWCSFVSTPTLLEDGSVCWDGIEFDISDLKKTEEELKISQEKFAVAFNTSPDAIFITEQQTGKIIEVNDAVNTVFGYSREEVIGKTGMELFMYVDEVERQKSIEIFKRDGRIRNIEINRKHKSGSDLILLLSADASVIDGKPCYISTHHDITQMKRAEEELLASQQKFAIAFNSTPDAIFISEEETGHFIEINAAVTSIFGYTREEAIGKNTLELGFYKDYSERQKVVDVMTKNGTVHKMEITGKHKSGTDLNLLISVERSVISNKQCLIATVHDITERKKIEMKLQKLNLDKDRFMSILGHDLRSPFNGIQGILELLHVDIDNMQKQEIVELIDMAHRSAKNASELLDDVLMWALAQSGKMSFNPENIAFKEDCSHIVELLSSTAEAKNISIEIHSEDSLSVYADKNMLDAVLRNLISNSLKFTNTGGQVIVSTQKTPENVIISVADNGVGIDPKNVDKLFDHAQLYTSYGTADEKGTGFGLKLCQEFVEKHGGKIWVESEVGKGTTFYFSLTAPAL